MWRCSIMYFGYPFFFRTWDSCIPSAIGIMGYCTEFRKLGGIHSLKLCTWIRNVWWESILFGSFFSEPTEIVLVRKGQRKFMGNTKHEVDFWAVVYFFQNSLDFIRLLEDPERLDQRRGPP